MAQMEVLQMHLAFSYFVITSPGPCKPKAWAPWHPGHTATARTTQFEPRAQRPQALPCGGPHTPTTRGRLDVDGGKRQRLSVTSTNCVTQTRTNNDSTANITRGVFLSVFTWTSTDRVSGHNRHARRRAISYLSQGAAHRTCGLVSTCR